MYPTHLGVHLTLCEYLYSHTHEFRFIMSAEYGIVKSRQLKAISPRPPFAWL
jgi:hypothetical protein